jgi:hypothetical protein
MWNILSSDCYFQIEIFKFELFTYSGHVLKLLWYNVKHISVSKDMHSPHQATVNQHPHQCTIHWMPVITQLWMNLNLVNILFHRGNQFCRK